MKFLTSLFGSRQPVAEGRNPQPAPTEVIAEDSSEPFPLLRHLHSHEGMPIIDWAKALEWVLEGSDDPAVVNAVDACKRGWLLHLRDALGYALHESEHAFVLSPLDERAARGMLEFIERTQRRIMHALEGIADPIEGERQTLIIFHDEETYYRYVSHAYPEEGEFALPEGGYPQCKVRLAERPLAERDAEQDDPGLEETIWIERLSPCHGIIRSVLYQQLGVDYGDVVLIDGAPITYHKYGEQQVPVFPHLATLVRNHYQFFDFAGTQDGDDRIASATEDLTRDSVVYSHTENYTVLCAACWRDESVDHEHGQTEEKHVVRGRIAAPPDLAPSELLHQLDAAMAARPPCRIYVPDLCEAAGLADRAAIERRRFEMLKGN